MANTAEMRSPELASRAAHCRKAVSRQLIARTPVADLGYASIDILKNIGVASLYELFVLFDSRGKGIATRLLAQCETLARSEGIRRIRLKPNALDEHTDIEELKCWYASAGYEVAPDGTGEWEKVLHGLDA